MTDKSPVWKKPSDVMRLLQKRKKVIVRKNVARNIAQPDKHTKVENSQKVAKRKNPFRSSPVKKAKLQRTSNTDDDGCELFAVLEESAPGITEDKIEDATDACEDDMFDKDLFDTKETQAPVSSLQSKEAEEHKDDKNSGPHYPFDWSLCTKLRVIGKTTFSWCSLKSKEETGGIVKFLREGSGADHDIALKAEEFQKCCMYYTYPNLPWLKLFPRLTGDMQIANGSPLNSLPEHAQKGLLNSWSESFTSVYHMLRNGHCDYFYLCTHQQTVLFRRGETVGLDEPQAIVTPTSRGFREALKTEDIDFEMPLNLKIGSEDKDELEELVEKPVSVDSKENDNTNLKSTNKDNAGLDDEEIDSTNEGASSWLEELGLDKKKYRSLDPNQVRLQRDSFRLIDNRPESMVFVSGYHTHTLYNYLLNYRGCFANTGVQAGIPPTILSPCAFSGATLKSLKVKQSAHRAEQQDRRVERGYSVELTGPVMPEAYHNILALVKDTHGEFTAKFSVHEPTTPVNGVPIAAQEDVGCNAPVKKDVKPTCLGKEALHEIALENGLYSWIAY